MIILKKILIMLLIIFTLFINISIISESTSGGKSSAEFELEVMNEKTDPTKASEKVGDIVETIVVVAQIVGTGMAFIMLGVLAMKYMAASPSDKADVKKSSLVYLVGAIVVFGVPQILKIIYNFSKAIK